MATPAQQKRDYYDVLGVVRTATPEEIKQAYRQTVAWHRRSGRLNRNRWKPKV